MILSAAVSFYLAVMAESKQQESGETGEELGGVYQFGQSSEAAKGTGQGRTVL